MALTFVQRKDANGTGNSVSVTLTGAVAAGNLLVITIGCANASATISSITGNGNTYNLRGSTTGTPGKNFVYDCLSAIAGATTITVTVNSSSSFLEVAVREFNTSTGTWAFDQYNGATGTGTTATSGNITTTQAAEVLVGYGQTFSGPDIPGAGWTADTTIAGNLYGHQIVAVTGTYAFTFSQVSAAYLGVIGSWSATSGPVTHHITATVAAAATVGGGAKKLVKTSITI